MTLAVLVFAAALLLIALERVDATKVAMAGAAVVVVAVGSGFDQDAAIAAIDFNTIGLLAGMMLLVRVTQASGVYDWAAIRAGQLAGGDPFRLVLSLAALTAVLSAFLPNLTLILLVAPITFLLADALDIDPIPIILIEVISSNLGGMATLIGDPPNTLIAGATGLSFNDFIVNLAPAAIVCFGAAIGAVYLFFRARLRVRPENRRTLMELDAAASIVDSRELRRTMPVLGLTIAAFFASQPLGLEPATIALSGATLALLVSRQRLEDALARIEWTTLFFLIGLFVMVGALEQTGAIDEVADAIADITAEGRSAQLLGILGISGFASGLVDNIPFTAAMIPVVSQLQPDPGDDAYWWALALGAGVGGNATIIAAAANIAAAGIAERAGNPISFMDFAKVGIPVTLMTMLICAAYVTVRYILL